MITLSQLIDLESYPVRNVLDILLLDRNKLYKSALKNKGVRQKDKDITTEEKNIIWATDTYMYLGEKYKDNREITPELITKERAGLVQPRVAKAAEAQQARTRQHAEVFTPSWVVNLMNNHCDEVWFEKKDVFNIPDGQTWTPTEGKIEFPPSKKKGWQAYINSRRLEITCGEAPYLVSRYDAATGALIPLHSRIGLLDRKMRVVNENTTDKESWWAWTKQAFRTVYGYEYQGDNLLIARVNLLMSFLDYWHDRWEGEPSYKELRKMAEIISWSLWQMDGIKRIVPHGIPQESYEQLTMFEVEEKSDDDIPCRFYYCSSPKDSGNTRPFDPNYTGGGKSFMKFDYVVGNPPYQKEMAQKETVNGQKAQTNIFHYFQIEADGIAREGTCLIYPAGRWIHRSGKGMKEFGYSQINDTHLSQLIFYKNSKAVFPTAGIGDGVSIVVKKMSKLKNTFKYTYIDDENTFIAVTENPGEELLPLNPQDMGVLSKISKFVTENNLHYMHDSILPRTFFGIESNFVESNPGKVREYTSDDDIDFSHEIKLFTNDKAGKAGRANILGPKSRPIFQKRS